MIFNIVMKYPKNKFKLSVKCGLTHEGDTISTKIRNSVFKMVYHESPCGENKDEHHYYVSIDGIRIGVLKNKWYDLEYNKQNYLHKYQDGYGKGYGDIENVDSRILWFWRLHYYLEEKQEKVCVTN